MGAMGDLRSQIRKRLTASVNAIVGDSVGSGCTIMVALPTIAHVEAYPSMRLPTLAHSDGKIFIFIWFFTNKRCGPTEFNDGNVIIFHMEQSSHNLRHVSINKDMFP